MIPNLTPVNQFLLTKIEPVFKKNAQNVLDVFELYYEVLT